MCSGMRHASERSWWQPPAILNSSAWINSSREPWFKLADTRPTQLSSAASATHAGSYTMLQQVRTSSPTRRHSGGFSEAVEDSALRVLIVQAHLVARVEAD